MSRAPGQHGPHRAPVIDLALARARHAGTPHRSTLVVRVATMKADEEVYRYIGFAEDAPLAEVQHAIAVAFSLPESTPAPAQFTAARGDTLGEVLPVGHGPFSFTWGLWRFDMRRVETHPRDASTPPAVCLAGAGEFGDATFDITDINRRLIGDDRADDVLRAARPAVRDVITRSRMFDYVLLIQALDLGRGGADTRAREAAASLPRERSPEGRDAYWCVLLGLACFADGGTTDSVIESTFEALGWERRTAAEVRDLCSGSLVRLASLGVYGPGRTSPVERVDVLRELLRR